MNMVGSTVASRMHRICTTMYPIRIFSPVSVHAYGQPKTAVTTMQATM